MIFEKAINEHGIEGIINKKVGVLNSVHNPNYMIEVIPVSYEIDFGKLRYKCNICGGVGQTIVNVDELFIMPSQEEFNKQIEEKRRITSIRTLVSRICPTGYGTPLLSQKKDTIEQIIKLLKPEELMALQDESEWRSAMRIAKKKHAEYDTLYKCICNLFAFN